VAGAAIAATGRREAAAAVAAPPRVFASARREIPEALDERASFMRESYSMQRARLYPKQSS
jgi:hypothetical protein